MPVFGAMTSTNSGNPVYQCSFDCFQPASVRMQYLCLKLCRSLVDGINLMFIIMTTTTEGFIEMMALLLHRCFAVFMNVYLVPLIGQTSYCPGCGHAGSLSCSLKHANACKNSIVTCRFVKCLVDIFMKIIFVVI